MTAPDLSAAEAEIVARFEAAPYAEESAVDRVARALWNPAGDRDWWTVTQDAQEGYRRMAEAAIGALAGPGEAEAALRRVEALADTLEALTEHLRRGGERAATLRAAASVRAALRGEN